MIDLSSSWCRRARASLLILGLPGAIAAIQGCSFLYDLKATQCTADADCTAIAEGLVCGPDLVCKVDDSGCATHADCLDRTGPDNVGDAACIKDQGKARGQCVTLTTTDCPLVLPLSSKYTADAALRTGNPIILGVFTSTNLDVFTYNYDLAATEFQSQEGGIPTRGGTRPLLMVACNGLAAKEQTPEDFSASLDRSMDHLIQLQVPGVASDLGSADLKRIFESKGHAAKMFFMSSQESDSSLNALADDNLMWEVLPGGTALGKAYKPVVNRTVTYLQSQGVMASTDSVRIAQVTASDISLLADISTTVQSDADGISFNNGKSAAQNLGTSPSNFLTLSAPSDSADLSSQVQSLLAFKPHIIISTGADEFLTKAIPGIETQWDANAGGQTRPFYILSPYQYGRSGLTAALNDSRFTGLQKRLVGINAPAAADPSVYNQYLLTFTQNYRNVTNAAGKENYYDAAYYLLYATAAAYPALTDGLSIAYGMTQLLTGPGRPVHKVGAGDPMATALQDLQRGPITLNGTDGPPDFNVATGGLDKIGDVWCVDATKTIKPDVLTYQDSDGTMAGTFPCFAGY